MVKLIYQLADRCPRHLNGDDSPKRLTVLRRQNGAVMNPRSSTRSSQGSRQAGRRDRGALEQRRLRAARLFAQGLRPAEVARQLGVSRQSATIWHRAWEEEGVRGLRQTERTGRPPLLTEKEGNGTGSR